MTAPEFRPCRHCGRPLMIVANELGAKVALDVDTEVYEIVRDSEQEDGSVFAVTTDCYVTHFATCPVSEDQRKRNGGAA